ncbi:MAG: AAA family ATPase [Janthinobacterium lividum]
MRLESLVLERYGNFEREAVRLDPRPGRLNLLVAPNGAGKSVLRQAFADLLYGIGGQSRMGFRFGYPGMRLTAELRDAAGGTVRLVRRKGHGGTLLDGEGRDGTALLAGLLGGTDLRRLQQLFSLDTERLRAGGRELLETGGDLAEALLSAGSGLRRARELERGFGEARDLLAPERKSVGRPFYRGLDALAEARRSGRAETLTTQDWEERQRGVAEAADALGRAEAEVSALGAALSQLERIRATRPLLRQREQAEEWLAAHGDAPVLAEALGDALAAAREAVLRSEELVRARAAPLQRHAEELARIAPDAGLLEQAEAIEALLREAATVRQIEGDLPGVAGELAAAERQAAALRGDLGVAREGLVLPARPLLAQAQALLDRHAGMAARLAELPEALAALAAERDALAGELAALPQEREQGAVEALVREVREGGDPARGLAAASGAAVSRRLEAKVALALVPGWGEADGAAALGALGPELPSEYDRRHQQVLDGGRALDLALREAAGAREARDAAGAEIDGLVAGEAPVEAEALAAARGHRDRGWDLVARIAFDPDATGAGEAARAWAGEASLPVAYVRAVQGADRLADRRVQEAARLDRLLQARLRLGQAEQAVGRADEAAEGQRARAEAARAGWREAVAPLRLGEGAGASDVREVLRLREAALAAAAASEEAEAAEAALRALHAGWAGRMAGLLGRDVPAGGLAALLAEAEQGVVAAREAAARRAGLGGRLDEVTRRIAQDAARLAGERERLAAWEAEWGGCLTALGRPAGEAPAAFAAVLELFRALRETLGAAEERRERVAGMERRCAAFADRAVALSRLGAPGLGALLPVEAAERLAAGLAEARKLQAEQGRLRQVRDQALEEHRAAEDALVAAHGALGRAVAMAGADTVEAAEALLRLAGERRRHEAGLAEAEARLLDVGAGQAPDVLRREAEAVGPDELAVALEAAAARQALAIAAQSRTAAEHQQRADALERVLAEDGASRAAAQQASAVALLGRSLDEALVQHAAALLLREGLRAVEAGGDNALAARIGAVFAAVTGGRYPALRVAPAEEKRAARLVAVEDGFPEEAREVEELSEGTRDQLFLALRLAAIEAEVAAGPSPPFLVDDVLQSFDDRRAVAAMQALLPLSEGTQVIVLTHHRHLLDLVGELPGGAVHVCGFEGKQG